MRSETLAKMVLAGWLMVASACLAERIPADGDAWTEGSLAGWTSSGTLALSDDHAVGAHSISSGQVVGGCGLVREFDATDLTGPDVKVHFWLKINTLDTSYNVQVVLFSQGNDSAFYHYDLLGLSGGQQWTEYTLSMSNFQPWGSVDPTQINRIAVNASWTGDDPAGCTVEILMDGLYLDQVPPPPVKVPADGDNWTEATLNGWSSTGTAALSDDHKAGAKSVSSGAFTGWGGSSLTIDPVDLRAADAKIHFWLKINTPDTSYNACISLGSDGDAGTCYVYLLGLSGNQGWTEHTLNISSLQQSGVVDLSRITTIGFSTTWTGDDPAGCTVEILVDGLYFTNAALVPVPPKIPTGGDAWTENDLTGWSSAGTVASSDDYKVGSKSISSGPYVGGGTLSFTFNPMDFTDPNARICFWLKINTPDTSYNAQIRLLTEGDDENFFARTLLGLSGNQGWTKYSMSLADLQPFGHFSNNINLSRMNRIQFSTSWTGDGPAGCTAEVLVDGLYFTNTLWNNVTPVTFAPNTRLVSAGTPIVITCSDPSAAIRYTTDGSIPTQTNGIQIASGGSVPITTITNTVLKARAWVGEDRVSPISTGVYRLHDSIGRARRLFLDHGLQTQALIWPGPDYTVNPQRLVDGHFSSAQLQSLTEYASNVLGPPEQGGWCDWSWMTGLPDDAALHSSQVPYQNRLINIQYLDEANISSPSFQDLAKSRYDLWNALYPQVLCTNDDYGLAWSSAQLQTFIGYARPDLILFNQYNFDGLSALGGQQYNAFYQTLQKYRQAGLTGYEGEPIAYGVWAQSYKRSGHIMSESEFRMQIHVPLAYGYTFFDYFYYNNDELNRTGLNPDETSLLFTGYGDGSPTPQFAYAAEANRQAQNLGPALVRLKNTDIRCIPGRHGGGTSNSLPTNVAAWDSSAGPYITQISVANSGTKNNGLPGNVFVGYFKVLDESFDGPGYTNETYVMIVNALTDPAGSAADTRQTVTIDFNFGATGITSLVAADEQTGAAVEVPLTSLGGSTYRLSLPLSGGTGKLFKFDTGASFVGLFMGDIPGDANRDGTVNFADFAALQNHYGQSVTGDTWSQGDFNADGQVTFEDFSILQNHYGQSVGSPGQAPAAQAMEEGALSAASCLPMGLVLMAGILGALLTLGFGGGRGDQK